MVMRLAECLNAADIRVLRRITEHYDFPCSRHSKMAMMQEITVNFRNPAFLESQLHGWLDGAGLAMLRLAMDSRRIYSAEEINAMFGLSGGEDAIQRAETEGWLHACTLPNGRYAYLIPEELQIPLRDATVDRFSEGIEEDEEGPLVFQDESHAVGRDLELMLEYIRHHDVRLTTEGAMYRRNLTQLLELLEITEAIPSDDWRFGYGRRFHDYPDRLALLYDFAHHKSFVQEGSDGVLTITDTADEWNTTSSLERQRQLFRFYVNTYRRPIPRLPLIIQLMAAVSPDWVAADSMLRVLGELVSEYYYDNRDHVWQHRILKMLRHLGAIGIGDDSDGRTWFQITKLGQQLITPDVTSDTEAETTSHQRILIVQPNFEIVVTADQPLVTAELAIFTDLLQSGVVRVYRLSETSMRRGLASGKSGDTWLEFLNKHAQTSVPGNVEHMVREWSKDLPEGLFDVQ